MTSLQNKIINKSVLTSWNLHWIEKYMKVLSYEVAASIMPFYR